MENQLQMSKKTTQLEYKVRAILQTALTGTTHYVLGESAVASLSIVTEEELRKMEAASRASKTIFWDEARAYNLVYMCKRRALFDGLGKLSVEKVLARIMAAIVT